MSLPDVDLDVKDRDRVIELFPEAIPASQLSNNHDDLARHKTGLYFQNIPVDDVTRLAAYPYDVAEELGFYKVDVIPNHVYDLLDTQAELDALMELPVNWEWFLDRRFYESDDKAFVLTHLGNYYHICEKYPPRSVEDIAILIALIRPGKKYLIGKPWGTIREQIWVRPEGDAYFFKKSHSIAFAVLVVLHAKMIAMRYGLIE